METYLSISMDDPVEMYLLAVRLRGRLPEPFHQRMLLCSFDEKHMQTVKDYLSFLSYCDERDAYRERMDKKLRLIDQCDRAMLVVNAMIFFALLVSAAISNGIK